jgi:hypothetical protein
MSTAAACLTCQGQASLAGRKAGYRKEKTDILPSSVGGSGCHRRARVSSTLIIHVHVGPADSRRKGQKCKKTAWECPLASLRQASLLLFAKIRGGLFGGYSMKSGRVGLSA